MKSKFVLITFIMLLSFELFADPKYFRSNIPADYWSFQLTNESENFDAIHLSSERYISFYDNENKEGHPTFNLRLTSIKLHSGERCGLDLQRSKKSISRWLECEPYNCVIKSSKTPTSIEITNPYHAEWIKHLRSQPRTLCSIQPKIKFVKTILKPESEFIIFEKNQKFVTDSEQKYFPDLNYCQKAETSKECNLNAKRSAFEFTSESWEKKTSLFPKMSVLSNIGDCLLKSAKEELDCLNSLTLVDSSQLDIPFKTSGIPLKLRGITWDSNTRNELKACLTGRAVGSGVYKGFKKLCFLSGGKIFAIDYPESYVLLSSLGRGPVNFEIRDEDI